jgi:hypothetical protein
MQVFSEAEVIIFQITFNKACSLLGALLLWQQKDKNQYESSISLLITSLQLQLLTIC